jgi:hypothetical protein
MFCTGYFRRDYYEPYGDVRCQLDQRTFAGLPGPVRALFDYAFRRRSLAFVHFRTAELRWWLVQRAKTLVQPDAIG